MIQSGYIKHAGPKYITIQREDIESGIQNYHLLGNFTQFTGSCKDSHLIEAIIVLWFENNKKNYIAKEVTLQTCINKFQLNVALFPKHIQKTIKKLMQYEPHVKVLFNNLFLLLL